MDRIAVVGNSGTGKTFFARRLAQRLRVPYTELDAMFHQAGWTELEETEFRRQVATLVERPRWVIDGNYKHVRDLIWARRHSGMARPATSRRAASSRVAHRSPGGQPSGALERKS